MKSTGRETNLKEPNQNQFDALLEMGVMLRLAAEGKRKKWNLFKKQIVNRYCADEESLEIIIKNIKDGRGVSNIELVPLTRAYIRCKGKELICDDCHYNPRQGKGATKYTKKRKFYCDYKGGVRNDAKEADPNKQPKWLDLERNICEHYEFEEDSKSEQLHDHLNLAFTVVRDMYRQRVYKNQMKELNQRYTAIVCDHLEKAKQDPGYLEKARAEIERYSKETEKMSTTINRQMLETVSDSFLPFNMKQYEEHDKIDALVGVLNEFIFSRQDKSGQLHNFYKAINAAGIRCKTWPAESEKDQAK